ncbi:MAG: restriction endonuclease [Oscillospiraceae bacterium]|nr:restriction endonuclease [Oscillospiraceae bacterium]
MHLLADEKRVWGIHTRDDLLFLKHDVIAIGWREIGDLSQIQPTREAFKEKYASVFKDEKKGQVALGAGMLYRFAHEMQIDDYIVFPSKSNREVNIGIVTGSYYYDETATNYVQQRKVKWLKSLPRTFFSQGALYEIGATMTLFSVKNYADEFMSALEKGFKGVSNLDPMDEVETVAATASEIKEVTRDFILKELSRRMKGYPMEEFVADLLRAMGYRADVSPQGGDSGIDITAYKDELPPRILVQVKSHDGDVKEQTIMSLKGAMREGDYGLFVTLSDYTKNAKKYLSNTPIIRGINGDELVELILKYYDHLTDKHRKMIPLQMIYIPMVSIDENTGE